MARCLSGEALGRSKMESQSAMLALSPPRGDEQQED
jgi:hypothetical protein